MRAASFHFGDNDETVRLQGKKIGVDAQSARRGAIGFRGVTSMLDQDVELGVATAFRVALIGISLAAGVLAGNVVTESHERRRH